MMRIILQSTALILVITLTGCNRTVSMREWQEEVERYASSDGVHNLNSLRQARAENGHIQFAVQEKADRRESTDVVGVLVGLAPSDRQPWLVFLVATVDSCELRETCAIALGESNGELRWVIGPSLPQSTASYIQRHGGATGSAPYVSFPAEGASFQLECGDGEAVVIERNCGARWSVDIESAPANTIVATDQ